MNILRKMDTILAAFGNVRAMERQHVDTHTEERIINISGIKVAESKDGEIWINFQELGGFLFMNATVLSNWSLDTKKGSKLIIYTDDFEIEIESDEKEIDSDFSNVSNTWITQISFVIEQREKEVMERRDFAEIDYLLKNEKIKMKVTK